MCAECFQNLVHMESLARFDKRREYQRRRSLFSHGEIGDMDHGVSSEDMIPDTVPDDQQIEARKAPQNGRLILDYHACFVEDQRRILSASDGPSEGIKAGRITEPVPFIEMDACQKDTRIEIIFMEIAEPPEYVLSLGIMLGQRSQIHSCRICQQIVAPVLILEYYAECRDGLRHMAVFNLNPDLKQTVTDRLVSEALDIGKAFVRLGHEFRRSELIHPVIEIIREQLHLHIAHSAL